MEFTLSLKKKKRKKLLITMHKTYLQATWQLEGNVKAHVAVIS